MRCIMCMLPGCDAWLFVVISTRIHIQLRLQHQPTTDKHKTQSKSFKNQTLQQQQQQQQQPLQTSRPRGLLAFALRSSSASTYCNRDEITGRPYRKNYKISMKKVQLIKKNNDKIQYFVSK
jgi:flagellar biosynthesis component FlhA